MSRSATSPAPAHRSLIDSPLSVVFEGGVARATINNPPLNLLDGPLMVAVDQLAERLEQTPDVSVLIVGSADPDFFIAHGDMGILDDPDTFAALPIGGASDASWNPMMRLHERLRNLPQITIGVLRGLARGGGAELFSALDLRYGSLEHAGLAQLETATGIIPGAGATTYLPGLIGRSRSLEVVLGGRLVDAATAERWGWLTRALPDAILDEFVNGLAGDLTRLAPDVVRSAKQAVDAAAHSVQQGLTAENALLGQLFNAPAGPLLTRAALAAGAQTRDGERHLEDLLDSVRRSTSALLAAAPSEDPHHG